MFEAVRCLGNESSLFDCDLSPWGVEGCHQEDILAVLCADDQQLLRNFTIISTESRDLQLTDQISNFLGIPSRSSLSQVVPYFTLADLSLRFCLSSRFDVAEASLLCRHLGFQCGAPDFTSSVRTENSVSVFAALSLSCPSEAGSDLLSGCQYHLEPDCSHQARLLCYSSCPPGLSLSASTTSLHSQTWQIELRDNVTSSGLEIYLDTVNILNQVSPGSRVSVATTLITDHSQAEAEVEVEVGRERRKRRQRRKCLRRLMVSVCDCLPWQQNSDHLQPVCAGQISLNCSQSVSRLWWSVGGDCSTAVQLTVQLLRVQVEEGEVCGDCGDTGHGSSLTYHLTGSHLTDTKSPNTLTIIKDQPASRTYIRIKDQSWISLAGIFGGLWSLLTGISVLSILELFYWAISHLSTSHNQRKGVKDSRLLYLKTFPSKAIVLLS